MPPAKKVTVKLPAALAAACESAALAAGVPIAAWLRSLAERETGVAADLRRGMQGAPPAVRAAAGRKGAKSRWG